MRNGHSQNMGLKKGGMWTSSNAILIRSNSNRWTNPLHIICPPVHKTSMKGRRQITTFLVTSLHIGSPFSWNHLSYLSTPSAIPYHTHQNKLNRNPQLYIKDDRKKIPQKKNSVAPRKAFQPVNILAMVMWNSQTKTSKNRTEKYMLAFIVKKRYHENHHNRVNTKPNMEIWLKLISHQKNLHRVLVINVDNITIAY